MPRLEFLTGYLIGWNFNFTGTLLSRAIVPDRFWITIYLFPLRILRGKGMGVFETPKKKVRTSRFLAEEARLQDHLGDIEEVFGLQGKDDAFLIDRHSFLLQPLQSLQSLF